MTGWLLDNPDKLRAIAVSLSALFTFLGIIAAITIAIITIRTNRKISKERATLDTLFKIELDQEYIELRADFNIIVTDDNSLALKNATLEPNQVKALKFILNLNELLALSIAEGSLDEQVYFKWCKGQMLRDWHLMKPFIADLRRSRSRPSIYENFEWLAVRWGGTPTPNYTPRIKTVAGPILSFLAPPA